MSIPESLINEAMKRGGIDIIDLISKALNLDPSERSKAHLELAEKFLRDGMELIDRDPCRPARSSTRPLRKPLKPWQ